MEIFEPLGIHNELDGKVLEEIEASEEALARYRTQDWDGAESRFNALRASYPERRLYALYLARIGYFRQAPPGPQWDGVFTHVTK